MGQSKKEPIPIEEAARNLAAYAIDREDLKSLIQSVPQGTGLSINTLEYELQILRILSIGWGLAFFIPDSDMKKRLTNLFWQHINEISKNISSLAQNTTGNTIDYFQILRTHMDTYLAAMEQNTGTESDPVKVIGPAFAQACGAPDNPVAILTGTKMFTLCLSGVKEYLGIISIQP